MFTETNLTNYGFTPVPTYSADEWEDYLKEECSKYPAQYERSIRNLLRCGKFFLVQKCEADEEHHTTKTPWSCGIRYCSHEQDVKLRYMRNFTRINNQLKNVKSPRVYHFTIGSNRLSNKKELDKCMAKFFRNMRRGAPRKNRPSYKMVNFKVLDVNKAGYWHYHIALLPESNLRNVDKFMRVCKKVLSSINNQLVFNNIGWRKKGQVISYMAQRAAGRLGHKHDGYYYLNDLMGPSEYFDNYYRSKNVSYFLPEWLVHTTVTCPAKSTCPICHAAMLFHSYERINPNNNDKPPPAT